LIFELFFFLTIGERENVFSVCSACLVDWFNPVPMIYLLNGLVLFNNNIIIVVRNLFKKWGIYVISWSNAMLSTSMFFFFLADAPSSIWGSSVENRARRVSFVGLTYYYDVIDLPSKKTTMPIVLRMANTSITCCVLMNEINVTQQQITGAHYLRCSLFCCAKKCARKKYYPIYNYFMLLLQ